MELHADWIEILFFCVASMSTLHAIMLMLEAIRDERLRTRNGPLELVSKAALERTQLMTISQGLLLLAGVTSLVMSPPYDGALLLSDQAVIFRLLVIAASLVNTFKLHRERQYRARFYTLFDRRQKPRT